MNITRYIVYCRDSSQAISEDSFFCLPENCSCQAWQPTVVRAFPKHLMKIELVKTWFFFLKNLHVRPSYAVFMLSIGDNVVHRAVVTKKSLKFPFMGKHDLQIGQLFTEPNYRRRGFAFYVLKKIIQEHSPETSGFWYVVDEKNTGSRGLALKAGFREVGFALRKGLLGRYILEEKCT